MTVYFIRTESGPIKIGYTAGCPIKRMKKLQTGHVEQLTLLAVMEGSRRHEADLHKRFVAHRLRGEWFAPVDELLALLEPFKAYELKQMTKPPAEAEETKISVRLQIPCEYNPEAGDVPWSQLTGHLLPEKPVGWLEKSDFFDWRHIVKDGKLPTDRAHFE